MRGAIYSISLVVVIAHAVWTVVICFYVLLFVFVLFYLFGVCIPRSILVRVVGPATPDK